MRRARAAEGLAISLFGTTQAWSSPKRCVIVATVCMALGETCMGAAISETMYAVSMKCARTQFGISMP